MQAGPEQVSRSRTLFLTVLISAIAVDMVSMIIVSVNNRVNLDSLMLFQLSGIAFYIAVIFLAKRASRLLQTLTALAGAGLILTAVQIFAFLIVKLIAGQDAAVSAIILVVFWSIGVDGHIISRTIQSSRMIGICIAAANFVVDITLYRVLIVTP